MTKSTFTGDDSAQDLENANADTAAADTAKLGDAPDQAIDEKNKDDDHPLDADADGSEIVEEEEVRGKEMPEIIAQKIPTFHGTQQAANLGLQSDASGTYTTNRSND
jgi:hypothetical protein